MGPKKWVSMMQKLNLPLFDPKNYSYGFLKILARAFDQMDSMTWVLDTKGKILFANSAALKCADISLNRVEGSFFGESPWRNYSDKAKNFTAAMIKDALSGRSVMTEDSIAAPDKLIPVLFSISPVRDSSENIIALISEAKVIEELKNFQKKHSTLLETKIHKVAKALKRANQFNRNFRDSAPVGVVFLNKEGRLSFANSKMKQTLSTSGIAGNSIKNKKLSEIGIFQADSSWKKVNNDSLQKIISPCQVKMLFCHNENIKRYFKVHATPLTGASHNYKGTVLVFNDITERKTLEEKLLKVRIRSEKMSSIKLLISGIAHELNNPLTSIIGCAEFLMEDANLTNDVNEAARIIENDAKRAGKIVENLLAFSWKSTFGGNAVNINDVIRTVMGIRVHQMIDRGIKPVLKLTEEIKPVKADMTKMQQVILNLLSNAVDAIGSSKIGDKIIIRSNMDGDWVVAEIADNGPGIPEEQLPKVFDPFFTTKPQGKGTGLGLSIAYEIIEEHGGSITVNSPPTGGATFIIRLPVYTDFMPKPVQKSIGHPWIPSKVLIVDDEKNIRLTLSKYLTALGCRVDTVSDAKNALDKLKTEVYDLMLSDLKMGNMNGLLLYNQAKEKYNNSVKQFAFMTGFSESHMESIIEAPNIPILHKPFSRRDILRFLRKIET
jgi:two-component system NtrC family sensor kinase